MRFIRLIAAVAILAAAGLAHANAQTLGVNLGWSASSNSTATDPGAVQVYRAPGTCAANPTTGKTYAALTTSAPASAPAAAPYLDATVTDGATYCYYVTATINSYASASAPSPTVQVTVVLSSGPASPTGLTATVVTLASGSASPAIKGPAAPTVRPKP